MKGLLYSFPPTGTRDQVPYPGGRYARVLDFIVHWQLGVCWLCSIVEWFDFCPQPGTHMIEAPPDWNAMDPPSPGSFWGAILIQIMMEPSFCSVSSVSFPAGRLPLQGGSMATRSHFTAVWRRPQRLMSRVSYRTFYQMIKKYLKCVQYLSFEIYSIQYIDTHYDNIIYSTQIWAISLLIFTWRCKFWVNRIS